MQNKILNIKKQKKKKKNKKNKKKIQKLQKYDCFVGEKILLLVFFPQFVEKKKFQPFSFTLPKLFFFYIINTPKNANIIVLKNMHI